MSFNQMLVIEPLNDDKPPPSTRKEFEPNTDDRYCQLGDSATAAILDGIVRALQGIEPLVLVGLGPRLAIGLSICVCKWRPRLVASIIIAPSARLRI